MEPAFASLEPAGLDSECHGVVTTLTPFDWLRLCASEGVPAAYKVVSIDVERYDGRIARCYTLQAARPAREALKPSLRYLALIREGAREAGLRDCWLERLEGLSAAPSSSQPQRRPPPARDYERRPGATFI